MKIVITIILFCLGIILGVYTYLNYYSSFLSDVPFGDNKTGYSESVGIYLDANNFKYELTQDRLKIINSDEEYIEINLSETNDTNLNLDKWIIVSDDSNIKTLVPEISCAYIYLDYVPSNQIYNIMCLSNLKSNGVKSIM